MVQFKISVENLIHQIFDYKSLYSQQTSVLVICEHYLGIIKAIKDELTSDLFKVKTIIEAEMFDDFLSQVAHGNWDEFTKEYTERFLDWTRSFMERYFPNY